jgi:hypothetical protein
MTKMLKRIRLVGLVALCLAGTQALSADVDELIFTDDANFAKPAELGSGWYIRGEIGMNLNGTHNVNSYGNPAFARLYDNNYTDRLNYSFYAGYKLNNYVRVDAGLGRLAGTDYSDTQLMTEDDGNLIRDFPTEVLPSDPNPCNGWGTFIDLATATEFIGDDFITNCIQTDRVEYDVTFGLANLYFDLPKFYDIAARGTPLPNERLLSGRIDNDCELPTPDMRPANPRFSSGPCAKRPGWAPENLDTSTLGRSHRSKPGKATLAEAIALTREILRVPGRYRIGIVPASDTGAVEMAMWSMLGERGVDMVAWESFGSGWITDVVKQLKLDDVRR